MRSDASTWMRHALAAVAASLAIAFAWVTPVGESPDELGHIRYAEALSHGMLPALEAPGTEGYEAHQPPLGYVLPALVLAVSGGVDIHPRPDPRLDFRRPGSRAFQTPFASPRDLRVLRFARMSQALWAAIIVWAGLSLASETRAALPYLLAPQLLFVCGAINNDAAVIACVSCALLFLVRCGETGEHALAAGLFTAAAFFAKASGLLLLGPVLVAAGLQRERRPRYILIGGTGAGLASWFVLNLYRFGTLMPPVPTARHIGTVHELLSQPRWVAGLFRSFWAKFGWLNTPMPWVFYLWFGLLSCAAVYGALRFRRSASLVLGSAVVANLVLLLAYLLRVDMQPQGRYLLPSLVAVAYFGSLSPLHRLGRMLLPASVLVAVAAILTIAVSFG